MFSDEIAHVHVVFSTVASEPFQQCGVDSDVELGLLLACHVIHLAFCVHINYR